VTPISRALTVVRWTLTHGPWSPVATRGGWLLPPGAGAGDEAVREILVHRQSFTDAELVHHHEAQAVEEAVILVLMALEIFESRALFLSACSVDTRQLLSRYSWMRLFLDWRCGDSIFRA